MYVIEVQVRAGNITGLHIENNQTHIFPADRCTWVQNPDTDGRGYFINDVVFFTGDAAGVELNGGSGATTNKTRLGYIGKTGRFVAITDFNPDV